MNTGSISFDRAAGYYDETRGFPPGEDQPIAALIARTGGLTPTSRVLEIGIGTGRVALPLSRLVDFVVGVDLSRPMMERLRAKRTEEPIGLVQGDATQLPVASRALDAAISVHVFHLIPDWRGVMDELTRTLKPDRPVVHCWTQQDHVFDILWDAWTDSLPDQQAPDVGVRWEKNATFLEELGWQPVGDPAHHDYPIERSPAGFLNYLRERKWSQTWRLSDAQLAEAVAAVERAVQAHFPEPEQKVTATSSFFARAYLPPR